MQITYRSNIWPMLCTLLALLSTHEVLAQPKNGPELTVAASVLHFGYQEFDDAGILLDREDGNIPGFVLGLSQTSGRWVFAGDFSYHGGEVTYTGQTNSPTPVPITTRTIESIADIALRSEYWLYPRYAHYLGAGYHYWDRDIRPTTTASGAPVSGLFENYAWWSAFFGAKVVMYESPAANWLLDVRLMRIINPTITIYFNGQYDNSKLALGERWGARLALPWRHVFNRSSSLNIEPYAESYELGRSITTPLTSNGTVVGSLFEPRSQTINYGLTVGISHRF